MAGTGVFGYAESDSEDEMPPGWEERTTLDDKVYYANHAEKLTQWSHPRTGKKKKLVGQLPPGWTRELREDGKVVFRSRNEDNKTGGAGEMVEIFTDPRLAFAKEDREPSYGVDGNPYDSVRQRFDSCTQALQILHGLDLSGRTAAVTGANCGIGFEISRSLALHGCHVVMMCRNVHKAEQARTTILSEKPTAKIDIVECNLASLASVAQCVKQFRQRDWPLHLLMLNAGIFAQPFRLTVDGYESTFQINYLGQFYLIQLFRPLLIRSAPSRVVLVSSESHRHAGSLSLPNSALSYETMSQRSLSVSSASDFWQIQAYSQSKMCQVMISLELDRQLSSKGVTFSSVHPGNMVFTSITRKSWLWWSFFGLVRLFTKTLQQAAATPIYAACAPELTGFIGGKYFNNCWFCPPDSACLDERMWRRLWDISVKMIEEATGETWESI